MVFRPVVLATLVVAFWSGGTARRVGAWRAGRTADTLRAVPVPSKSDRANVERLERALADDSMEGRGTATRGGARAARFLATEMTKIGLAPAGDSGYFQRVPMMVAAPRAPGESGAAGRGSRGGGGGRLAAAVAVAAAMARSVHARSGCRPLPIAIPCRSTASEPGST